MISTIGNCGPANQLKYSGMRCTLPRALSTLAFGLPTCPNARSRKSMSSRRGPWYHGGHKQVVQDAPTPMLHIWLSVNAFQGKTTLPGVQTTRRSVKDRKTFFRDALTPLPHSWLSVNASQGASFAPAVTGQNIKENRMTWLLRQ